MFNSRLKRCIFNNRLIKHIESVKYEIGKDEKSKKRRFFIGEIPDWPHTRNHVVGKAYNDVYHSTSIASLIFALTMSRLVTSRPLSWKR